MSIIWRYGILKEMGHQVHSIFNHVHPADARTIIEFYGFNVVLVNTRGRCLHQRRAIFTIAIIFTGTFTDFKKREKVGGELAASLKALYNDSRVLPMADEAPARVFRTHVRDLHRTMQTCFQKIPGTFRT